MPGTATMIHPLALCESTEVGEGTRIWPYAHVMGGAKVGRDCNVGETSFIEAGVVVGDRVTIKNGVMLWTGVTIGDDVFIGPGVVFTNDLRPRRSRHLAPEEFQQTWVEDFVSIGANATIVCGITIGRAAMIGAGAVVTRSVNPHELVVGNPAHKVAFVCECGEKLNDSLACACGLRYHMVGTEMRKK